MAKNPFGSAGLGQFGQDQSYSAGGGPLSDLSSGLKGFAVAQGVAASGLEKYLNDAGYSYANGKVSKVPGAVAPDVNPYANTGMPAASPYAVPPPPSASADATGNTVPPIPALNNPMDSISNMGHDILNAGKSVISSFLGG